MPALQIRGPWNQHSTCIRSGQIRLKLELGPLSWLCFEQWTERGWVGASATLLGLKFFISNTNASKVDDFEWFGFHNDPCLWIQAWSRPSNFIICLIPTLIDGHWIFTSYFLFLGAGKKYFLKNILKKSSYLTGTNFNNQSRNINIWLEYSWICFLNVDRLLYFYFKTWYLLKDLCGRWK